VDAKHVQLSSKEILEKDFKTAMRGYNQIEVDEFLDVIIKDYEALQQQIDTLQTENNQLKKRTTGEARTRTAQPVQPQPVQQVNYDVLKRLSNLEKEVFGKKTSE